MRDRVWAFETTDLVVTGIGVKACWQDVYTVV